MYFLFGILFFLLIVFCYFFIGLPKEAEKITWGVNFSQKQAQNLNLDWKKTYLALLDNLGVKNLKIAVYWDLIEPEPGKYNFDDLDWQINQAGNRGVNLFLVVGVKVPRWPECHEPDWVQNQKSTLWQELQLSSSAECPQGENQKLLLEYIEKVVNRYKNSPSIWAWQVENEPFFSFGECPKLDKKFLEKEINLVKSLAPGKPVIISESGEFSLWFQAAKYGDMVGTTMYKKVWLDELNSYLSYPFPPIFYQRKALLVNKIFGKRVICVELQTEPWGPKLLYDLPLKEQEKTMNLEQFRKNIKFARKTGFDTFYLWGGEWWYWLKTKQNNSDIWDEAKKLF